MVDSIRIFCYGVHRQTEEELRTPVVGFLCFLKNFLDFFDTVKQVTKFEAELESLVEKLTEVENTLEEMDKEYKERDEEV